MRSKLRVAMLIQTYFPHLGGAELQLASLAPLLRDLDVELYVLTRRLSARLASFEVIEDVPVYRLPVPGPKPLAALSFSLSAMPVLQRLKPDLIHAHELLSPTTTALMAKRLFGIPVVAKILRGGVLGDLAKLRRAAYGKYRIESIRRGVDSFIVISHEIDQELSDIGVSGKRRTFIPNGVNLTRFSPLSMDGKPALRQALGLPEGLIVIYSGRLEAEKCVKDLVRIWPEVLKRDPHATLLILGTGAEEQTLRQMAGVNVRFEGKVEDVAPYLRASDIFVLPSITEGLSNSLLEAMASGLAPIATSTGGALDVIVQDQNGILIPPGDPQALTTAIMALLSDPDRRARFGVNGRATAERDYSLPAVAHKLRALYETIVY